MFEVLDRQTRLTGNQKKILAAAIIGDALEFFDYFLIGFVLAFLIGPWKLTFGQSAIVLMSSGIGAIIGAYGWGWLADRIGRRKVFIGTVLNFSIATGLLYFTPDNGWIYLTIMRFFVGFGVGGLYCVDLPLVQEFMPTSKRGWVGGLVTCVIPLGVGLGAILGRLHGRGAVAAAVRDRRAAGADRAAGAAVGAGIAALACRQGRFEEARKSLAWALQVEPSSAAVADRGRRRPGRQDQLVRPLQISAQPDRLLAWQCRRADRRLRRRAVGARAVRAAAEGDAAGSRQDDDPADASPASSAACPSPGFPRRSGGATAGGLLGFGAGIADHPRRLQLRHHAVRRCRPSG